MWSARAVLFADLGNGRVQRVSVPKVESYSIDSALDTDSDSFQIEIGDPFADFVSLLKRDNEVRLNLFGGESGILEELQQGIADEVAYTEEGTLVIRGRDLSCIATDSIAKPYEYTHFRPHMGIRKEARKLGFREFDLTKVPAIDKFFTDGSETYWEKWYRAYRKRDRWLWLEPNGVLKAAPLAYTHKAFYRFGTPKNQSDQSKWIPVSTVEYTSRKQGRIGVAYVVGQSNDVGVFEQATDASIKDWLRRPLQVFQDVDVHSRKAARKRAFEEINDAKIGAIEIVITIPHPGFIVRQNRMAQLRIPQMGIDGTWFIVGTQILGNSSGAIQKIRLRQKGFALTRKIPDDPKPEKTPGDKAGGALGDALGQRWGDAFVKAAREFHGQWPFDLFLATLLAICSVETGFRNVRYAGDREWYPRPGTNVPQNPDGSGHGQGTPASPGALNAWKNRFANARNNPKNPLYPNSEAAVGPMQLVTPGFKVWADEYGGKKGEYDGGRWKPEANIRAAARAFKGKLQGLPVSQENMFYAAGFRYYGSGSDAANRDYANRIKNKVLKDPGYLALVREAATVDVNSSTSRAPGPPGWGGSKAIIDQIRNKAAPNLDVISAKRSTKNTSSGHPSDHWTGSRNAYAYDLSDTGNAGPSPGQTQAAKNIMKMLGMSWSGRGRLVESPIIDGYRIQVIYNTPEYGDHRGHIHLGVKKV